MVHTDSSTIRRPRLQHQITFYRQKAWRAIESICSNFLGYEKAENYNEIVQELISLYSVMGCNMSLKLHFFAFPCGFFSSSLKTWEPSLMNVEKGSIIFFPSW